MREFWCSICCTSYLNIDKRKSVWCVSWNKYELLIKTDCKLQNTDLHCWHNSLLVLLSYLRPLSAQTPQLAQHYKVQWAPSNVLSKQLSLASLNLMLIPPKEPKITTVIQYKLIRYLMNFSSRPTLHFNRVSNCCQWQSRK